MSAREGALDARRVRVVARWDVIVIVGIYIVGLVWIFWLRPTFVLMLMAGRVGNLDH